MLASVAAELGAALITRNPADFVGVGELIRIVSV
jgi:predicted nucleic acid-binding protein